MTKPLTLGEVAKAATDELHTFSDTAPDLIDFGIPTLDRAIGGLTPGQGAVLALSTGVGKTSTLLASALRAKTQHGLIFLEDPATVIGAALLAACTGINSLDIRRKRLSANDKGLLREALEELGRKSRARVICHPGAPLEAVCEYVDELASVGCRMLNLDYVNKIRGIREDRVNEVGAAYTTFQSRCFKHNAACTVAAQLSRTANPTRRPSAYMLANTSDLEKEARVIILGWRNADDPALVHFVLEKSTMGAEGLTWSMRRDKSGFLRDTADTDRWEDDFR